MDRLFKNWNSARLARLITGVVFAVCAVIWEKYALIVLSVLLFMQAKFDIGCFCLISEAGAPSEEPDHSDLFHEQEVARDSVSDYE